MLTHQSGIVGCMLYLSLSVVAELWGIPFLHSVYKLSTTKAAFTCSFIFIGWFVGAPLNGWISDLSGTRRLPLVIGSFLAAITLSIIIYKPANISPVLLSGLLFLFGLFSSVEVICFAVSRENNPTYVAATSIAFTNLIIMAGGMIFQPLIGKLFDLAWRGVMRNNIRIYSVGDYQHAFWILPICIFIGGILALMLRNPRSL